MLFRYLLHIAAGFISGSIMYSYLVAKHLYNVDITVEGEDKNPGMTNVMRCVGTKQGLFCLVLDVMKGFFPVLIASGQLDTHHPLFALVIAAPVMGHAFSPMLKGKGGKAIAVTFGTLGAAALAGSNMLWALAVILIFLSVVVVITPHSLRMIVSMAMLSLWCLFVREPAGFMLGGILISVVVIYKHIRNYDREPFKIKLLFKKTK